MSLFPRVVASRLLDGYVACIVARISLLRGADRFAGLVHSVCYGEQTDLVVLFEALVSQADVNILKVYLYLPGARLLKA